MSETQSLPSAAPAPTSAFGPRRPARPRWRRAVQIGAVAAVAMTALASCRTPPPTGGGGGSGRYRSEVFSSVQKTANIRYSQAPNNSGVTQNLLLDIYRPAGDTVTKRPLLITAYGGAFIFGSKDGTADPAYEMAQYYAKRGYVTAMINYRLLAGGICTGVNSSASCRTAAIAGITDGMAAVRFLRANAATYGIDPDRIAITGDSAGGVIAAGAGVMANLPLDAPVENVPVNRSTPGVSSKVQAFMAVSGGLPETQYIDGEDSPGILFTGTADTIVPSSYSTTVANALTAAGVDAKVVTFPGAGHVPWGQKGTILPQTTDWFYTHMDLANAAR
jgi:para-nitrobenzyl esterase